MNMKKRALSLLLCVMLIVGMLPATAMAAGTAGTWDVSLEVTENTAKKYNDQNTLKLSFAVQSDDLKLATAQSIVFAIDPEIFDVINTKAEKLNVTTKTLEILSGTVTGKYKIDEDNSWAAQGRYAVSTDGKIYVQILASYDEQTACTDKISLASILLGFKSGKSVKDLTRDSIRFAKPAELGPLNQSAAISITDGADNKQDAILADGSDGTLKVIPTVVWKDITLTEPSKPALGGSVTIDKTSPKFGDKLTADTSALDYGTESKGELTYQWYRGGEKITGATGAEYTTVAADMNKPIKVEVKNSNNSGSVFSAQTNNVAKAAGPAAPTGLAEVSKTANSITVTANAAWEYSIDGGSNWQLGNEFTGLEPNKTYNQIVARVKARVWHEASAASTPISVTTDKGSADSIKDTLKATHTPYTGTYDGNSHNAFTADMSSVTGWTATYSRTETGTYGSTLPTVKDVADSGKIYVKFSHNDYADVCIDYTVTVNKADYTFTQADTASASVGTAKPTTSTENATGVPGETVSGTLTWYTDAECNTAASGNFKAAGDVDLWWKFVPEDTATNYDTTPKTGKVTYTVSNLPAQEVAFANASETKHFGDSNFTNAATSSNGGAITYSGNNDAVATVDAASGEVTIHGVGTVTITATAAATATHSAGQATYKLTVKPKAITPTVTVTGSYKYNGNPITPTYQVEITTGETLPEGQYDVEIIDNTNAGNGTIKIKAKVNGNYSFEAVTENFTIAQADTPAAPTGLTGMIGKTLSTVTLTTGWTWANDTTVMNDLGKHSFSANYHDENGNYADGTESVTVTVVDKADAKVTITGAPTGKTYGDKDFTLSASAADAGIGTGTWTWTSNDSSVLKVTGSDATATVEILKAGSATISAKFESETTVGTAATDTITVGKATITVAAKNQKIYVNGTAPDLSSPVKDTHYTVTGLVGSDTLGGKITMGYQKSGTAAKPDVTTTGTYDIVIIGAIAPNDNYEPIVFKNATLTIAKKSSSSGGGSGVATYAITVKDAKNGDVTSSHKTASAGTSVTLTVAPDKGYALNTLTVLDSKNKEIKLTQKNGKYTFTMPAGKVTVEASFRAENPFTDVPADAYYAAAVKWAEKNGITGGIGGGLFGSDNNCTRAQIVTFIYRNMK